MTVRPSEFKIFRAGPDPEEEQRRRDPHNRAEIQKMQGPKDWNAARARMATYIHAALWQDNWIDDATHADQVTDRILDKIVRPEFETLRQMVLDEAIWVVSEGFVRGVPNSSLGMAVRRLQALKDKPTTAAVEEPADSPGHARPGASE